MLLAAVSLSVAASSPVCDFRLTLQSDGQKKYTNGSSVYTTNATFYESLGLKTRAATCVNGGDVGPGKPPDTCHKHCAGNKCCVSNINEYIEQSDDVIRQCWDKSNLSTELTPDSLVILDLEHPAEARENLGERGRAFSAGATTDDPRAGVSPKIDGS